MTYYEKYILGCRLERAEYLIRFQIASNSLAMHELQKQLDTLQEQASLLSKAGLELWARDDTKED